jgi:hypothetical protein
LDQRRAGNVSIELLEASLDNVRDWPITVTTVTIPAGE